MLHVRLRGDNESTHSYLLQHSTRLVATTLNNSKFQDSMGATMDNHLASMETKTNDNDYILGVSIEYSLELIHVQLLHLLHLELFTFL
jgi:hypothetical protein